MERKFPFYRGCLLGLAIGDAMGYPVDSKNWEEIQQDYGPNGLLGYDLQHDYADITSYTQLAVFAANGLLAGMTRAGTGKLSQYLAAALREWAKGQQYRSTGERGLCWAMQIPAMRRRQCMDTRMTDTLTRQNLGSLAQPANGFTAPSALTAAAAVGMFFAPERMDPQQVGILGAEAVAMTHGDPETFLAGAVLAYTLAGLLQDPDHSLADQFTQAADAVRGQFGSRYPQETAAIAAKLRKAISLVKHTELTSVEVMTLLECKTASECLAGAAYASLIHPANFDAAVIAAVNHSGRSCAVGAITGAVLGAKLGEEALPEFYLESLEPKAALGVLAEDLVRGRQVARIFDDSWDQKYIQGCPVLE